jgi:hypothetical protein
MTLTDFDRGWLIGLLDGEGWIGLLKMKNLKSKLGFRLKPIISISNANRELIEIVHKLLGGFIEPVNPHLPTVTWEVTLLDTRKIRDFLEENLRYIIAHRQRAKLLLEFCNSRLNTPHGKGQGTWYTTREIEIRKEFEKLMKRRHWKT